MYFRSTSSLNPDFFYRWSLLGGRRRKKQISTEREKKSTTATRLFMCNLCGVAFLENAFLLSHHRIKGRIHKSSVFQFKNLKGLMLDKT